MNKCTECRGKIPSPGVICEDCYTEGLENKLRDLGGSSSDLCKARLEQV